MTNTEYVEHFKALVGVVETYGGVYSQEPGLMGVELIAQGMKPEDVSTADHTEVIKAKKVCSKCYLSCMLLRGTDNGRYFQLKVDLSNDMTRIDTYPKTIVETMRLLTDYMPRQDCSACAIRTVRDWPLSRVRAACRAVQRVRAKLNGGIVAGSTSRTSALS